jgi:Family of unknown function (DUF6069)
MATDAQTNEATGKGGKWKRRLVVVLGAMVAAIVVFLIAGAMADTLRTPAMNGQPSNELNVGLVAVISALASFLGWGLLALLEKFTAKGAVIWRVVATVFLLLSLGAPFSGTDITTGNRISLALMHVAVGAVLILFLPGNKR